MVGLGHGLRGRLRKSWKIECSRLSSNFVSCLFKARKDDPDKFPNLKRSFSEIFGNLAGHSRVGTGIQSEAVSH